MWALIDALVDEQLADWEQARKGFGDLSKIVSKEIPYGAKQYRAQFNPARMVSSGAKVDKKSIAERPCFLCPHALMKGQKGLLLLGKYLWLINPFPILKEHFTIPHLSHIPQELSGEALGEMAELAELVAGRYDIYFNGATAGASAPDHFHFQAGAQGALPLCEQEVEEWIVESSDSRIGRFESSPRTVLLVEASTLETLQTAWDRVYQHITNPHQLNLIMRSTGDGWRLWVILRSKHRPDCYNLVGEAQMMVSPGVIDMAGVAVLVRPEDYDRMDGTAWHEMMREVSLSDEDFAQLIEKLR